MSKTAPADSVLAQGGRHWPHADRSKTTSRYTAPWWNPAVERRATNSTPRIDQDRALTASRVVTR
jgi:hypothetical protein